MDNMLCQVTGDLQFRDKAIRIPLVTREILLVECLLAGYDLLYLLRKNFVFDLFTIEVLGPF